RRLAALATSLEGAQKALAEAGVEAHQLIAAVVTDKLIAGLRQRLLATLARTVPTRRAGLRHATQTRGGRDSTTRGYPGKGRVGGGRESKTKAGVWVGGGECHCREAAAGLDTAGNPPMHT